MITFRGKGGDGDEPEGSADRRGFMRQIFRLVAVVVTLVLGAGARADIDLKDMWDNSSVPATGFVFPNWLKVKAASYDVWICEGCGAGAENIKGMTVVNFGTAGKSDFAGVYWKARCGASDSGLYTMTYAGTYTEDTGVYPAWTWAGTSMDVSGCADLCGNPVCGAYFTIDVYVDIVPCPTDMDTIRMGFPVRTAGPFWGSISDNYGFFVPWGDTAGGEQTIVYAMKSGDKDTASPGDTVTYTVFYGRPGANPIQNFIIFDTQPLYTHYVFDSANPDPDPGWDPFPGTPLKLRWTVNGPFTTTGGPTAMLTFRLSVDWGNGNAFEAGSGDVAAPEGYRLNNYAQVFFNKATQDCVGFTVTAPAITVVRRFLYWLIADNDVLFSASYGQSPDEMIYSIFAKNVSDEKTWWDVHIWDTVPPELDPWCVNCGLDDPCAGWTMTPSGCASAAPGRQVSGTKTLLTWKLDMPPGMTIELRWKAQVKPSSMAGSTAVNQIAILEIGKSRIVDGTGHSSTPATFAHVAPVVLPTTYISYVAHATTCTHDTKPDCMGYLLAMFPLNRKTQFDLRGLEYQGAGWPSTGGVSASIGTLLGDCIGGFPGGGGISGGGHAGCKSERIPAYYSPSHWAYDGDYACPTFPQHNIYKVTSNSPVLWQYLPWLTGIGDIRDENDTPAPATTLNYCGLMHYMFKRYDRGTANPAYGDALTMMSTGLDAYGNPASDLNTMVHLFFFDYTTNVWEYRRTYDLGPEGVAYNQGTPQVDQGPWRTISSAARLIVDHGSEVNYMLDPDVGGVLCAFMPCRETGNCVKSGPAYFYGIIPSLNNATSAKLIVGNVGAVTATYAIERYFPDNMAAPALMPAWLNGTSGRWAQVTPVFSLPAGLTNAGNPDLYWTSPFLAPGSVAAYRVRLDAGGPVQALAGFAFTDRSGGAVHHAIDGNQTGTEFWMQMCAPSLNVCPTSAMYTADVFCPSKGMVVQAVAEDGYSARYTTSGPDQCVSFLKFTDLGAGGKRNVRFYMAPGSSPGNFIMQHIDEMNEQKGYTAPFIFQGVHYTVIVPPVVFAGQPFWITVVVMNSGGSTKTDYAGTTSFTSTDPGAKIQATLMDSYNYAWNGCGTDCGVKIFMMVSLTVLGTQTIVAGDTLDGSITGLAATLVVGADIKLEKRKKLTVAASGDTVEFQICWSNYSSASGFSFTITDAVPMGTTYVPEIASTALCAGSTPVPGVTVWYSTATTTTPPGTFTSVPGTGSPLGNSRWLRWTIRDAYVNSTGCVCFKVSVN